MRRALLTLLVVVLGSVVTAVPAGAHAEVREADPPVQGTGPVGEDEITITFITMDPDVPPEIDVLDPDGNSVAAGDPEIVAEAPTGITVALPVEPLEAGRHVVVWRAMSIDGDGITNGDYEFVAEESAGGGAGVWLLWALALAIPAAIFLRPKGRRGRAET